MDHSTIVGDDQALVGSVVGERYRVGTILGVGTTGTVFAAEHVAFARPAALKVLRPRFADAALVGRVFHGEARAAWSVSHPCLAEVFDIGTLPSGDPFLVMERLEGTTLAKRLTKERLSVAAAVDVMMQLLSAIATIHARDLLLRDLRPQNVFLAHRRGCRPLVKILDFGLARLTPLDRLQTDWDALQSAVGPSERVGSTAIPFYLSPERTQGEHRVEPASDLFVAAILFYEMLAGERPFNGMLWRSVVSQVLRGSPGALHERRPEIPSELSDLVARALSPDPRARPATANEMQEELRAIFEGGRRRGPTPVRRASSEYSSTFISPVASPAARAPRPRTSAPEMETVVTREPLVPEPFDESIDRTLQVHSDEWIEREDDADTETTRLAPELQAEAQTLMRKSRPPRRT